jgi:hypothetical protein
MGIFWRWFGAFALLSATFNPTPWNYLRWTMENHATQLSLAVFLGLLLAIGYLVCLNATLNAVGGFGLVLVGAVFAALAWVLFDWGMLTLTTTDPRLWFGLFALSVVMAVGLSWGIVLRRLSPGDAVAEDDDR